MDRPLKVGARPKRLDQLCRRAQRREWRDLQHIWVVEVQHALILVLRQQRLRAVLAEYITFFSLARRARGGFGPGRQAPGCDIQKSVHS